METYEKKGRAWKELNFGHLRNNVRELKQMVPPDCRLMPAVKADAYGHGAVPVARELARMGIRDFCVASVDEGIQLRTAGIRGQILVLGYTPKECLPDLAAYGLTQTVVDGAYAEMLAGGPGRFRVQAAVDTGMHRLGFSWTEQERVLALWRQPNLAVTGVFSHLCVSDEDTEDARRFTMEQGRRYRQVLDCLYGKTKSRFQTHLLGSYGILRYPELAFDAVRPGILLYGVHSSEADARRQERPAALYPVLSLKARIACVREVEAGEGVGYGLAFHSNGKKRIAVASAGYADGIPRALSGKGHALVRGVRAPVVGRICMDQLFLDVSEIPGVCAGDEAVFIGESLGQRIRAEEMAQAAGTITNELLSRLGKRLETRVVAERSEPIYNIKIPGLKETCAPCCQRNA